MCIRDRFFEVLEADKQIIVMRRYLTEDGNDVFCRQVEGPNEAIVRIELTKRGATGSLIIDGEIVYS